MASEYTPNYNLDLYASTDKPNLRDQYNAAMGKIDTQMKTNADNLVSANNNIGTLQTTVGSHTEQILSLQTEQGELSDSVQSMQTTVSQHTTQIGTLQSDVQENGSDIASMQGTVSQHTTQIGTLQSDVQENASDIDGLDGRVQSNSNNIGQLQTTTEQQQIAINGINSRAIPKLTSWGTPGSGNVSGTLVVDSLVQLCTLRIGIYNVDIPTGSSNAITAYTVPEQYRPTARINLLLDVVTSGTAATAKVYAAVYPDGRVNIRAVGSSGQASGVSVDGIVSWFYGASTD